MSPRSTQLHAVTGAFGYSGQHIARRLLEAGHRVRTLTSSPGRPGSLQGQVEVAPLCFQDPAGLRQALQGVQVLHNTYWVRFNHRTFTHANAVQNTRALFQAAQDVGVERVVHVSITNPSANSDLEYFRGKGQLEEALASSGLSHAILRPAVLFGGDDILVNNMAWAVRHLPVLGVFGDGGYRLQPIHVEDLAGLAVTHAGHQDDVVVEAIGPEPYTFRGLLELLCKVLGRSRPVLPVPPRLGYLLAWGMGRLLQDVLLTWEEIEGLMADLLYVDAPPAGTERLSVWARAHAGTLGLRYASEMARRRHRRRSYGVH